ncbi:MAG: peptidase S14 [Elusimicrobia bacterium]|nr:MAG: peptidase S14 [Elusimicrobiota bacterium]
MRFLSTLLVSSLLVGPGIAQGKAGRKDEPNPFKKEQEAITRLGMEATIEKAKHDAAMRSRRQALDEALLKNREEKVKETEADRSKKRTLDIRKLDTALEQIQFSEKLKILAFEKEKLSLEHGLALEKLKKELIVMELEQKRLEAKGKLAGFQFQSKLAEMRRERDQLLLESQLISEREKKALTALRQQKERSQLELDVKLIQLRHEKELLKADNDRKIEHLRKAHLENQSERDTIDLELKRISLKGSKLKFDADAKQNSIALLRADLDMRAKKHEWKNESNKAPVFSKIPYKDGTITISDRRIALNGPIYGQVADHLTERIHYFNNVSADPIFLVIDYCPGGSVMAGARILKAIENSKAPVHVVLKSFAASMAAVIVTLAERSYSYPNAVMLHHQMWGFSVANTTQLQEELEIRKAWEKRLFHPVAKKLGYTMERFRKEMYKNNSDGDWQEFSDTAVKLKWVGNIVQEIRETGVVKNPDAAKEKRGKNLFSLEEHVDDQGKYYVKMPRLQPFDLYYMYNEDNYYR